MKKKSTVLYYRARPDGAGLVFALAHRAKCVARVHYALQTAQTWAEFRQLMPRQEYSTVLQRTFDDEPRPLPTDAFSSDRVWGYCDGDYPDWLQQEMLQVLPHRIQTKYGTIAASMHNGDCLQIDVDKEPLIVADLQAMGFTVVKRTDLFFY